PGYLVSQHSRQPGPQYSDWSRAGEFRFLSVQEQLHSQNLGKFQCAVPHRVLQPFQPGQFCAASCNPGGAHEPGGDQLRGIVCTARRQNPCDANTGAGHSVCAKSNLVKNPGVAQLVNMVWALGTALVSEGFPQPSNRRPTSPRAKRKP